ncbi:S1 RNA-binding domain-containing protein [Microbispora catharanthi]|uniref:S1 RNA-binding domain-containing protein n=2 Tax=Microbispora catharanthi TaxID=1712871 RepID=A0A5N6B278_9ACTN|nr:S1 RNA-binding domain-containing protein [Microbispora catharanthi]
MTSCRARVRTVPPDRRLCGLRSATAADWAEQHHDVAMVGETRSGRSDVLPRPPCRPRNDYMPNPALNERELAFLRTLRRGQVITGRVIEIADFGVTFVDIGGFTAMINIPELSWRRVDHPADVVTVGQEVTAEVLDVDVERGRVPLSLKALQKDPLLDLRQQIGRAVTGSVTKVAPIGAFVRIEDATNGFEGLVPSSELADRDVKPGDILTVEIVRVDLSRRRIELALRAGRA